MTENQETRKRRPIFIILGLGLIFFIAVFAIISLGGIKVAELIGKLPIGKPTTTQTPSSQKAEFSFTDPSSGAKIDIGLNSLPQNFPAEFPIYPQATITSSVSGSPQENLGIWLTLSSPDPLEKVISFYQTNLKTKNWKVDATTPNNWSISKDNLDGYLAIQPEKDSSNVVILIVLGEKKAN